MSENHFTPSSVADKSNKPARPYPEYPLGPHPAGYWCKRIRGVLHYFGPHWQPGDGEAAPAAATAALDEYLAKKDALHAGKKPRPEAGALTVKEAANEFLTAKTALVDSGELSPRTIA